MKEGRTIKKGNKEIKEIELKKGMEERRGRKASKKGIEERH